MYKVGTKINIEYSFVGLKGLYILNYKCSPKIKKGGEEQEKIFKTYARGFGLEMLGRIRFSKNRIKVNNNKEDGGFHRKMKSKKVLSWLFAVILAGVVLIGAGCGQQTTTPPAPSPEDGKSSEEPAKVYQPVELNFATWHHPTYPLNTGIWEPFIEEIEKVTEGRVKIYFHPGSVLVKGDETFDAVRTGTVDMGFTLQAYTRGIFPLTSILEFPFLFTSATQVCLTTAELLKNNEAFQKEYGDVVPIWVGATDTSMMVATKKVNKVGDFKGLRIRTPGTIQNDVCEALDIVPISMPYPEV